MPISIKYKVWLRLLGIKVGILFLQVFGLKLKCERNFYFEHETTHPEGNMNVSMHSTAAWYRKSLGLITWDAWIFLQNFAPIHSVDVDVLTREVNILNLSQGYRATSRAEYKVNREVPETAVPWMATWGWLQEKVTSL